MTVGIRMCQGQVKIKEVFDHWNGLMNENGIG
jgi:hypothetical protein